MTKKKMKQHAIAHEPGTLWLNEYDWITQFAEALNGQYENVTLDAGKVRGLALTHLETIELLADVASERGELMQTVGMLIIENNKLKEQLAGQEKVERKLQVGDRVQANDTAGFHKGAMGVIQFVEPSYEKVWVLREGAGSPVFYAPSELTLFEETV